MNEWGEVPWLHELTEGTEGTEVHNGGTEKTETYGEISILRARRHRRNRADQGFLNGFLPQSSRSAVCDAVRVLTNPAGTNELTRTIIGCAIRVHKECGPGLLESAYIPCLSLELRDAGLEVATRVAVPLTYRGIRLDVTYFLDILVAGTVVVEIKSVAALAGIHTAQLLTYLRLTKRPVGLLINFNVPILKQGVRRVVNPGLASAGLRPASD